MAVPSACPDSPASVQHIRPVGTSVGSVVVSIVRGLYGKNGFLAILVVGQKDVAEIFQVAILGVYYCIGVVDDFLHIVAVDMANAGRGFVAVAPRQVQVTFGQVRGCGNLIDAATVFLLGRQHIVGGLEVVNDFAKQFFVAILIIAYLLYSIVLKYYFIDPRYLTENGNEFVVEVCTEELHLCQALVGDVFTQCGSTVSLKRYDGTVAARYGAIEAIPQLVHVVGIGGSQRGPDFQVMVVGVSCTPASFQAVVRREVTVWPQVEGIGVPAVTQHGVGGCYHGVGIGKCFVFVNHCGRIVIQETVAVG